jgi:hypothetical protein
MQFIHEGGNHRGYTRAVKASGMVAKSLLSQRPPRTLRAAPSMHAAGSRRRWGAESLRQEPLGVNSNHYQASTLLPLGPLAGQTGRNAFGARALHALPVGVPPDQAQDLAPHVVRRRRPRTCGSEARGWGDGSGQRSDALARAARVQAAVDAKGGRGLRRLPPLLAWPRQAQEPRPIAGRTQKLI